MKCSELMIGDKLKTVFSQKIVKVKEIKQNCIYTEDNGYEYNEIEPIPLIPEILEHNGFKVDGYAILNLQDGKWLEYYFHEHRFSMYYEGIDEWQNHSQVRDIVHRSQPFYVHELQHALRLCGLTELADNFKVEE